MAENRRQRADLPLRRDDGGGAVGAGLHFGPGTPTRMRHEQPRTVANRADLPLRRDAGRRGGERDYRLRSP